MNIDEALANPLFSDADPKLISRFRDYHQQNPHVYAQFKVNATAVRRAGRSKYSAWSIINKVRWDFDVTTKGDVFRINNDFIALYARLLIVEDPSFDGFFDLRQMKPNDRKVSWEEKGRKAI